MIYVIVALISFGVGGLSSWLLFRPRPFVPDASAYVEAQQTIDGVNQREDELLNADTPTVEDARRALARVRKGDRWN